MKNKKMGSNGNKTCFWSHHLELEYLLLSYLWNRYHIEQSFCLLGAYNLDLSENHYADDHNNQERVHLDWVMSACNELLFGFSQKTQFFLIYISWLFLIPKLIL